jgi:hypothetical protein
LVERMGRNFDDYPGFQPKKHLGKHMQHSVTTSNSEVKNTKFSWVSNPIRLLLTKQGLGAKGLFKNYVDNILAFFDHLPPSSCK